MKTRNEICNENNCETYTLEEFAHAIRTGKLHINSGQGYYHDGDKLTNIPIPENPYAWEQIRKYPYICFFRLS